MYIGLDCEMVGYGRRSFLAQVTLVDYDGNVIYNQHVKLPAGMDPNAVNYRTQWSGVTKNNLVAAKYSFTRVRNDVAELLKGNTIVGHGLENDFKALGLNPADYEIKDTAHAPIFQQYKNGKFQPQRLKTLAALLLNKTIQTNTHNPAEDAQTAMELFRAFQHIFDLSEAQVTKDMHEFKEMMAASPAAANKTRRRRRRLFAV